MEYGVPPRSNNCTLIHATIVLTPGGLGITKGEIMSRKQLDGARELLADAIVESVKRRKKLTLTEWELIITYYDAVARIEFGRIGRHGDGLPERAKYRLAEILDEMILDIEPEDRSTLVAPYN
jgi:hypothetical protein